MLKKILSLALLAVLFTGCKATFTNLTPKQQVRNDDGLYPVEVAMDTRTRTTPRAQPRRRAASCRLRL